MTDLWLCLLFLEVCANDEGVLSRICCFFFVNKVLKLLEFKKKNWVVNKECIQILQ